MSIIMFAFKKQLRFARVFIAAVSAAPGAVSAADGTAPQSEGVTVTATRIAAPTFDIPASISSVPGADLRDDALGVNLSDDIAGVPGLLARNRHNYAQDQQISIRGFGASSAFGIRGVRVYQDGIPASGPDGQGQVSQFNLDSADRVEVLRGPFSALYGNSSGGVIQIFTAAGEGAPQARTTVDYGSFDTVRAGLDAAGAAGPLDYNVDFTHFSIDGYRDHSHARHESFNGKMSYTLNEASRLTLIANLISRPDAQDPLGLTPAQFTADPNQTAAAALTFNTRKNLNQQLGGAIYELNITDAQSLRLLGYLGHRTVEQFLSIPVSAQSAPRSSGGVVDLNRQFGGADAQWSWRGTLAGQPLTWVLGAAFDRQNERRRGYNNFSANALGVQGSLRRDENNIVDDRDEYAQGSWDFAPRWSLMAGLRHSEVRFDSDDHFITATNPNDSGAVSYGATSPVAGLLFKARRSLHLYAAYGQGFQTPLGSELAYRADGAAGLNLGLKPARGHNEEAGAKFQISPDLSAEAVLFRALTRDEIVVNTSLGGRSTYQNSGRTRREGAEASLDYRLAPSWRLRFAYTALKAQYVDSYLTCLAAPCGQPTVLIPAGNRLPGVPRHQAYAALRWGGERGWHAALSGQYLSDVAVNDLNTVAAPAYATFGALGGYVADRPSGRFSAFLRLDNLLDRHYVGSVIVDDGNGRYFEPGPGFNALVGVSVSLRAAESGG